MILSEEKKDIRKLDLNQIIETLEKEGEKGFRAKQIYEWLWKKSAQSFDEMSNLSLELRKKLNDNYRISPAVVDESQISNDGGNTWGPEKIFYADLPLASPFIWNKSDNRIIK